MLSKYQIGASLALLCLLPIGLLPLVFSPESQAEVEPLPDFGSYTDTVSKKVAFFNYLRPLVVAENAAIEEQRQRLLKLNSKKLSNKDLTWVRQLKTHYRLPPYDTRQQTIAALIKRVDGIPVELALAQAAIESAWATSRFAKQGNNMFGQWCYEQGCGMVPRNRHTGAAHEVKRFKTPKGSVKAYFLNLNTHPAYAKLRTRRLELRQAKKVVTAEALAITLDQYSELGEEYIQRLLNFIRINKPLMLETK